MSVLAFVTVVIVGFVACAEFGSYAFVHPVLRRLPPTERITVEKGLLRTFGRIMPPGMVLCVVLTVTVAIARGDVLAWAAAASVVVAVITTVVVNVPINLSTGRWDPAEPPAGWERTRSRWELFQGIRSWLLLVGFVLVTAAIVVGS